MIIEVKEDVTIPFTHNGVAKKWFWWFAFPAFNIFCLASLWTDWGEYPRGVTNDVILMIGGNLFLPFMALGDRLSPKVTFQWNKHQIIVPRLGPVDSFGLGYSQSSEILPFAEIGCVPGHPSVSPYFSTISRRSSENPVSTSRISSSILRHVEVVSGRHF